MGITLLLYSSRFGHTQKIMQTIQQYLLAQQVICEIVDLHQLAKLNWHRYQQVILGASIRYGHFNPLLWRFIQENQQALKERKTGFFCVSLVARKPGKSTIEGNPYLQKFLRQSPWQPSLCAAFEGALSYPKYRWFERRLIQLIMLMTQGVTDLKQEIEYTNWQKVIDFAKQFNDQVDSSAINDH